MNHALNEEPISKVGTAGAGPRGRLRLSPAQRLRIRKWLVLEICGDLNLSRNDALDRLAEAGKRHDARPEKGVDGGSALAVEEVEELHDEIQVTPSGKLNCLEHAQIHIGCCRRSQGITRQT